MYQKVSVNADGGSRGNPGPAAIGIIIFNEKKIELERYKERIGNTTNNVAEYKALIKALERSSKYTQEEVHVFMDSELIIKQMKGLYEVKAEHLLPLFKEAKAREKLFKKVIYNCIRRENNVIADDLVNQAVDNLK